MPHFFYPIDDVFFRQRIQPALGRCRRQKSFAAGKALFTELLPRIEEYHRACQGVAGSSLVEQAAAGLPFDAAVWSAVVGEVLLFAAAELPLLNLSPQALCCLLAPGSPTLPDQPDAPARRRSTKIEQVLYGSRDLAFAGGCYRPEAAGYNDAMDVARLADYLIAVDPGRWSPADLSAMTELPDDEERGEELEFVRQSWPDLVELYRRARERGQIMACESDHVCY